MILNVYRGENKCGKSVVGRNEEQACTACQPALHTFEDRMTILEVTAIIHGEADG